MGRIAKEWIPNSAETDDELSEGEFTDEESMRKYYITSKVREMEVGIKKRKKSAKKAEKRMGGPPKIWSEEANRKKVAIMVKDTMKKTDTEKAAKVEKVVKTGKVKKTGKTAKPAKAVKVTKVGKTRSKTMKGKEKGERKVRKSRGAVVTGGKITLLVKENPKRKGTNAHKKFELYKKHKDIASFLEAGGKRSSLRYDEKHGYIKLSSIVKKGEGKDKKGEE